MKAMILAAGLGTRLRPWTLAHPKALVPVGGVPMLERVIISLRNQGYDEMVVNIHHFGEQIVEFVESKREELGVDIKISDERGCLLDTGGGIVAAFDLLFGKDSSPVLIHNVDILSNDDLNILMKHHKEKGNDITLLTSDRESSRKLIFSPDGRLRGWHNLSTDEYRPADFLSEPGDSEMGFSGIYILEEEAVNKMNEYAFNLGKEAFPIMDFFLSECETLRIGEQFATDLRLIDIGKPASLKQANLEFM